MPSRTARPRKLLLSTETKLIFEQMHQASMDNFKERNKYFYTYELNKQIKKVFEVYIQNGFSEVSKNLARYRSENNIAEPK